MAKKASRKKRIQRRQYSEDLKAEAVQMLFDGHSAGSVVKNLGISGSGSTLIGCEQTGRKAFLMELDPPYCDVIVERWEKFTGQKAERHSITGLNQFVESAR
jgi:hypothetical protein